MARSGEAAGGPLAPARLALIGFTLLAVAVVVLEVSRSDVRTTFEPRARRPAAVVTDGRRVLEVEARTGRIAATLLALPANGTERILGLAPRPGSLRGLPLVVLSEEDGRPRLWWLDEDGRRRDLPPGLGPAGRLGPEAVMPVPVWSPDGSHVAWLQGSPGSPVLRVLAWNADGPRQGDQRHSVSSLATGVGAGARLEGWRWQEPGPEGGGLLLVSDDRPGLYQLQVRRAEGRVRPVSGRLVRLPGALIDRAAATRTSGETAWPRYTLLLPMETGSSPQLRWSDRDGSSGTLPLPAGMRGSRARWWVDAFGPLILLGDGQNAWALSPDGTAVAIAEPVAHGAVLERLAGGGGRPITPPGPGRQVE